MTWWYHENCRYCGSDGELHIVRLDSGELCFRCAECGIGVHDPAHINNPDHEFEALRVAFTAPTNDEIIAYGWGQYMKVSERE